MQAEIQAAAQAVQEVDYHENWDPRLLEAVLVVVALLLILDQVVEADFHAVVSPEYHILALVQAQAEMYPVFFELWEECRVGQYLCWTWSGNSRLNQPG
eukprot:COSAG01_NODE_16554_length_1226_cov_7.354037_2_plen_99_part_00